MTARERILIVDDDPFSLTAFEAILAPHFHVETATGGAQALSRLDPSRPYAVIISDMYMPDMDGIDFLARASVLSPTSVKIMLTGHADLDVAMAAVNRSHVFGFFSKTCQPTALVAAVRKALVQHRLLAARSGRAPSRSQILSQEEVDFLIKG